MKTIISNPYKRMAFFALLFLTAFFLVGAVSAEGFSQIINDLN